MPCRDARAGGRSGAGWSPAVDGRARRTSGAGWMPAGAAPWVRAAGVLALLVAAPGGARAAAAAAAEGPLVRLPRADAWYGLATVVAVGGMGLADDWFRERAAASAGDGTR